MMTAQEIFERAMALMDEGDETGRRDSARTAGYKDRALPILNILGEECRSTLGEPAVWETLTVFDVPLSLEEGAAGEVLPYGLAAHLFLEEDPAAANFFQQRYEELLDRRRRRQRGTVEPIVPPYGGLSAHEGGPTWR